MADQTPPDPDDPTRVPGLQPDDGDGDGGGHDRGGHDREPAREGLGDGDEREPDGVPGPGSVGDGDGYPEPDDEELSPRPRRWPVVVVGLLAIVGLVASTVLVRSASSGDDPADPGIDGSPATTDEPPEPATEAEIEAAVDEISAFVAEERGVPFLEPVTVELEGEGDFQARLLEDFDEDADDLRQTEVFLEGLGLVDPDVDLVDAMRELLGGGVVGFYDAETHELVVRGAALTPYVRTTIAHELTHALDDQHHDLDRPEYDDADDEVSFGFSAVVEGNARRVESAYLDSLSDEEARQAQEEEVALGSTMDLGAVPLILVDLIGAPYTLGEPFVGEVLASGGEPALDAAFAEPPRTSEQVIDPARFLAGEPPVDVRPPEVAGETVDEGVLGELMVLLVLAEELGIDVAREAATGWGGDWGVAWRDGDRSCVSAALVGDDLGETEEMRIAFERWAAEQGDARVVPADGAGPFTVESCSR